VSAPRVPDGCCVYAVGDIHGRRDLLDALLERIWADAPATGNNLVFLGDYIDRGPDSKATIECLANLQRPGWEIVTLRGNHDQMLLDFLGYPEAYLGWRSLGGSETLLSYGVKPPLFSNTKDLVRLRDEFADMLPRKHRAFFEDLRLCHVVGDYFFVHAGVRPAISLDRQSPEDLLGIREDFLFSNQRLDKVVVHGHTPSEQPVTRGNRICVDTGAYATNCLTAVKLSGRSCNFLSTGDT